MSEPMSSVLGGFAGDARPSIKTSSGKVYSFTFDVPVVLGKLEEMCLRWLREKNAKKLAVLDEKGVPGTVDFDRAQAIRAEYERVIDDDEYKIQNTKQEKGYVFEQYAKTPEGRFAYLKASLSIAHPEADDSLCMRLMTEYPDEVMAIFGQLGKAVASMAEGVIRTVRKTNPEKAAAIEAKMTKSLLNDGQG